MPGGDTESAKPDAFAEIERLRAQIAHLEQQVEQLDRLAHEDALICLPNRRAFMRALDVLISRVARYGEDGAMLFVDIDGLKQVNDRYGHKAGDEALVQVGGLLRSGVRKSDFVARLGGDEFGILLAHADEASARDTALRLTRLVGDSELTCDGNALRLGVAIGPAVINKDDTPDAVISRADQAMYRDKAAA